MGAIAAQSATLAPILPQFPYSTPCLHLALNGSAYTRPGGEGGFPPPLPVLLVPHRASALLRSLRTQSGTPHPAPFQWGLLPKAWLMHHAVGTELPWGTSHCRTAPNGPGHLHLAAGLAQGRGTE